MSEYRTVLERAREQFPAPEMPLGSLFRRRDRRQRNKRIGTAVFAIAVATVAIGGAIRAFRMAEAPRPANLPSTPQAWTRVPFPTSPGDEVLSITAGGPGLVATGVSYSDEESVIWTSTDGRTWNRVERSAELGTIYDVTTAGPGLVAVGTQAFGGGAGTGDEAPIWTSADGFTWTEAPSDHVFRGAWLRAVAVGGPGLVAVGSTLDGPQAWFSSDGLTWDQASMPPLPPDISSIDSWMQDVAVAGDHLVAVGQIGFADCGVNCGRYEPAIWTSTDGVTWTEVPLGSDGFPRDSEIRSVADGPGGFVAAGGIYPDVPMVWRSREGLTWHRVSAERDAFVSRSSGGQDLRDLHFIVGTVAAGSDGYVALGGDQWCMDAYPFLCSPAEGAVWTSTDGTTWVRVRPGPVFELGRTTRVEVRAVTALGSRFVAAGTYGDGVAVWISEPLEG
jgi:hypothetical protein